MSNENKENSEPEVRDKDFWFVQYWVLAAQVKSLSEENASVRRFDVRSKLKDLLIVKPLMSDILEYHELDINGNSLLEDQGIQEVEVQVEVEDDPGYDRGCW